MPRSELSQSAKLAESIYGKTLGDLSVSFP